MFKPIPVILFLYVTLHFASSMQLPIFPLYIQDIVKDVRHIGSLYALFAVFVACSMVFAGYLGKAAKIYFWIAGYLIYGLYSLALYYEPSVLMLYGLQIVGGAAYGMACACLRFILSYMETGSDGYAKTFNTMKLLSLFLGSVAFLISGLIVHYSSIQNIFFVSFVLVALCLVLAIVLIRKMETRK